MDFLHAFFLSRHPSSLHGLIGKPLHLPTQHIVAQ